ncbi:MAG TPA: CDP-archaeol synthase [Candidatus Nanoarchaeia archaeon]|nr:CDP-archaeol synthase [Candidatus Nanoarchaeia archaeon]
MLYVLSLLYFMLPAYLGNMFPLFARKIPFLNVPLDGATTCRGVRLLGPHKTMRGLIAAILGGALAFYLQVLLYDVPLFNALSILNYPQSPWFIGALMGFGAIWGDAVKSFFKRQCGVQPGRPWIPFDEIDYSIGALLIVSPWVFVGFKESALIIIISALFHVGANYAGYYLGIKKNKL